MKGQKQFVIEMVEKVIPGFVKGSDNALKLLSAEQLEEIKTVTTGSISSGGVEYSKDRSNWAEVRLYARSMVMNHLKKAKELNGGLSVVGTSAGGQNRLNRPEKVTLAKDPDIDYTILPEDLASFVRNLV